MKFIAPLFLSVSLLADASVELGVVDRFVSDTASLKEARSLLKDLKSPLSAQEEARCLQFLKQTFTEDLAANGRTRQNDLANWLLDQPQHVNPSTEVLLEVISGEDMDIRWREFCVQKLALALEQPVLRSSLADQCVAALIEKAGDPRISFSGTALLGLYGLSKKTDPLVDKDQVMRLAEYVLKEDKFPSANKVTALQVAGLTGSEAALSLARAYSLDSSLAIQLRISAIALLGSRGNPDDISKLNPLTQSVDYRLRKAAQAALRKLSS